MKDGVARLRLEGSCNGCAASASTFELAVEEALRATAPDLEGIDVEGAVEPPAPPAIGTFELPMAGGGGAGGGWQALEYVDQMAPGGDGLCGGESASSPMSPATCSPETATAARGAAARSTTATSAAAR